ncbi:L-threonylcarbamoyladenylate synthase [uncultured Roseobacter sp.]|uniref:L-threonylcarbamoyladenylate synthase n=1 Tax=uncultured Roseobacter sp. TaxID=114847 RepID=UPI002632949B|nr:L-threonylcarbamoyladenylate synthase [uncultured Roseobacter sp.]
MTRTGTETLRADAEGMTRAAHLLRQGSLVAFPTETVYGLGADARNADAVAAVYAAKGRPSFNPLIVHVADTDAAKTFVRWNDSADSLAQHFWPGPLTLVLPLAAGHGLATLVTAGLPTVAIRVPAHPAARALLRAFGGPVAAPSANPSGRISPTRAEHVLAGLDGRIAAVLDDGPCSVGLESTIIAPDPGPVLLRAGGLAPGDIERVLGTRPEAPESREITSPGQLLSHYAPGAPMRLNATSKRPGEVFLGFGPMDCDLNLSETGDLQEAAANLFDHMHSLDRTTQTIAVAPVPETGLGIAINDRLRRAAAPR